MRKFYLLSLFLMVLTMPVLSNEPTPYFSSNLREIMIDGAYISYPTLSPDGSYLFLTANYVDIEQVRLGYTPQFISESVTQQIWAIDREDDDLASLLMEFQVDDNPYGTPFVVSPDATILAILGKDAIHIKAYPDFTDVISFPVERNSQTYQYRSKDPFTYLAWSPNGEYLAYIQPDEIRVWNLLTYEEYSHLLPDFNDWEGVIYGVNGWIIGYKYAESDIAFVTCTLELENCNEYFFEEQTHTVIPSPDRKTILTMAGDVFSANRSFAIWELGENDDYTLTSFELDLSSGAPFSFLSDSQILFRYGLEGWTIREFPSFSLVSSEIISDPIFFPAILNNLYGVTIDRQVVQYLQIYELPNGEIIDELNLLEFVENPQYWIQSQNFLNASEDGTMLMVYTGPSVILVPIDHH